jgi:hypothetical protein
VTSFESVLVLLSFRRYFQSSLVLGSRLLVQHLLCTQLAVGLLDLVRSLRSCVLERFRFCNFRWLRPVET